MENSAARGPAHAPEGNKGGDEVVDAFDPLATFIEWGSEADRLAYANL